MTPEQLQKMPTIEERMLDTLFDNKSDEADDGSWIASEDYHKAAKACADVAREEMQREAMAFAGWIAQEDYECYIQHGIAVWRKEITGTLMPSSDLYTLYTQQKQA